jgi:hypothetical protein
VNPRPGASFTDADTDELPRIDAVGGTGPSRTGRLRALLGLLLLVLLCWGAVLAALSTGAADPAPAAPMPTGAMHTDSVHTDSMRAGPMQARPDPVVAGVLAVVGMVGLIGFVGLVAVALRATVCGLGDPHRTRRMLNRAWWATAAGTVLTLLVLGGYAAGEALPAAVDPALLSVTVDSDLGLPLRARLSGLVVAAVAIALLVKAAPADRVGRRLRGAAVLAGSAALAVTWTGAGPLAGAPFVPALP